jgi:hypothetical protein
VTTQELLSQGTLIIDGKKCRRLRDDECNTWRDWVFQDPNTLEWKFYREISQEKKDKEIK